ncbi:MAG: response regulator [Bryobacter sp.]|jgi:two-component system chemotaxis response regulator CheY|nr:response regulator [Bryobacter sp. CoA8 C33]
MAKRIITVDDAATMRRLIAYTLRGAGHEVLEAEDGEDALRLLGGQGIDLVITDINMPKMDGIELVRRLRSLPRFQATPILLLTTESDPEKKRQGKEAGATGWITKPFQPDQLVAAVAKVTGA